jgi:hypothetical protein
VSNKIEDWHTQMSLKKQGNFVNDKDFFEIGNSPNKFDSSDDGECTPPQITING